MLTSSGAGEPQEDYVETFGGDIPVGMEVKPADAETPAEPAAPAMQSIGALVSCEHLPHEVRLHAEGGMVRVVPRAPGIVRVDVVPTGASGEYHSWAVTREDWPAQPLMVNEGDDLSIEGEGWLIDVTRSPLALSFRNARGEVVLSQSSDAPMQHREGVRALAFDLAPGEAIYGLGNQSQEPLEVKLDRRGHAFQILNRHPPMTLLFPFWTSSRNVGVFIDNPGKATIDFGAAREAITQYASEAGEVSYYVFLGESMADVLDLYTQVTGRPALAPRWTLGNLQSRFGFNSFEMVQSIIDGFDQRRIPLDSMILDLDWFGGDRMGNLEFQQTDKWPNPTESLAKFRAQGIKMIPITEPQVSPMSFNAPEVLAKGLVAREADGKMSYGMKMWISSRVRIYLLDFTMPETRAWWAEKHRKLIQDYGFAGFWQDLNEPEGAQDDMVFAGGTGTAVRNVIGLLMNRALAEAIAEHRPGARPFIMSRSGYAGMQKYGAGVWSGDVQATWVDLSRQPALGLSTSMAGIPYWNSDIGGYAGESTPELYLRWCQFAFFNPIYRPHAAFKPREPWAFGPEVEAAARALLVLRYRLLPYFYNTSREAFDTGMPMMRPLVLRWPDDPAVRDLDDQFLYGPSLMAAPLLAEGATAREVYLPAGTWYDWFTGTRHDGPATITQDAPLATFPLFVLAPAIIPMGPEVMRTDERPLDAVTLRVYLPPGVPRAQGYLYEDDGLTLAYQSGAFAKTRFTAARGDNGRITITIEAIDGEFDGRVQARSWAVELHDADRPTAVRCDGAALAESATGAGWCYDDAARVLTIETEMVETTREQQFEVDVAPAR